MGETYMGDQLFSEREVMEGLNPEQLVDLILAHGEKVSEYEKVMSLASDVLEGAYGTDVCTILNQRERQNGKT